MKVLGLQLRAARGALNWSVAQLSQASGVPTATIVRHEASEGVPASRKGNLNQIVATLEQAGIEFIGSPDDGPGIRFRAPV